MTDSDQYWHGVAKKCFALSTQMRPPIFFWKITMNPYWLDYQALKRGSGKFSDAMVISIMFRSRLKFLMQYCKTMRFFGDLKAFVWRIEYQQRGFPHAHILFWTDAYTSDIQEMHRVINAPYPESSSIYNDQQMIRDCTTLIRGFQIHHHTRRCRNATGQCKFGDPQAGSEVTRRQNLIDFERRK
jgi:hypothetical protein